MNIVNVDNSNITCTGRLGGLESPRNGISRRETYLE